MKQLIIEGQKELTGEIKISGAKNSVVALIPAAILSDEEVTLYNVPNISDTNALIDIIELLNGKVEYENEVMRIDTHNIENKVVPENLSKKLRASYYFMGALLGKYKEVKIKMPGGCYLGPRPIDLHLKGFKKLGICIEEKGGFIKCYADRIVGNDIHLDFPSVGATENIILASVFAEGETILSNAAMEPEIIDLQNFLNRMGAKVEGAGTNVIRITGVRKLNSVSYNIMPDRIEAGTFLCMAAVTAGEVILNNVELEHINPVIHKLKETGSKIIVEKNRVIIQAPKRLKAVDIKTLPYPGFPTDMQSIFVSTLTVAKGSSMIVENIFENRYKYVNELIRMGAKIKIEGKVALVKGVRKLISAEVNSTDLRGGAAMCVAALTAKGKSKINNIEYILRGYENLEKKITNLGGKISKID